MTSSALNFLTELRNHPDPYRILAAIPERYNSDPFFEEEWIDFKSNPQANSTREIWSKALSGFANIADGMIIWGINARKTPPRNIDAAFSLVPVPDPALLQNTLRDLIRDATNPPVIGVQYLSVPGPSGAGFLVCYIPQSPHRPHRAEFAGRQYYWRAGDDFLTASPELLRLLFYPKSAPYLWLTTILSYEPAKPPIEHGHPVRAGQSSSEYLYPPRICTLKYEVNLHNTGTSTAKDMFVVIQNTDHLTTSHGSSFSVSRSLHPQDITLLFTADFKNQVPYDLIPFSIASDQSKYIKPSFIPELLNITIYAENIPPQKFSVTFQPDDFHGQNFVSKIIYPKS